MSDALTIASSAIADGEPLQVLSMALAGDVFALETTVVLEVLDLIPLAAVPNSRPFIKGLINVRGKVVPVVDLKVSLGMGARGEAGGETTRDARIVVLSILLGGEETMVGILADKVFEVMEIALADLEDTPSVGIGWRAEYVRAIGKTAEGFIVILDIDRVFAAAIAPETAR